MGGEKATTTSAVETSGYDIPLFSPEMIAYLQKLKGARINGFNANLSTPVEGIDDEELLRARNAFMTDSGEQECTFATSLEGDDLEAQWASCKEVNGVDYAFEFPLTIMECGELFHVGSGGFKLSLLRKAFLGTINVNKFESGTLSVKNLFAKMGKAALSHNHEQFKNLDNLRKAWMASIDHLRGLYPDDNELFDSILKLNRDFLEKQRDNARRREDSNAEIMKRRSFLKVAIGFTLGASAGILGIDQLQKKFSVTPPQETEEKAEPQEIATQQETDVETLKELSGLALLLRHSARELDPENQTWKDNLLLWHKVSEYFLGDRFTFTTEEVALTGPYVKEPIMRFAARGYRSGYLDKDGGGSGKFNSTYLSDAINDLLDYENLTDYQIAEWISWAYIEAFNVYLPPDYIQVNRMNGGKKVNKVTYIGSDRPTVHIQEYDCISDQPSTQPGGNATARGKRVPIISDKKDARILLQSGLAQHDLRVPAKYLDPSKPFVMNVDSNEKPHSWKFNANGMAKALKSQLAAQKRFEENNSPLIMGEVNGRRAASPRSMDFVPFHDSNVKAIADSIAPDSLDKHDQVKKITKFVQGLGYKLENLCDYDRHPLLTLFNGEGDCNNQVVLWASLIAAKGIDFGIFHIASKNPKSTSGHVVGGIKIEDAYALAMLPEQLREKAIHGFIPIELTNTTAVPGQWPDPSRSKIYGASLAEAHNPSEQGGWTIQHHNDL